MSYLLKGKIWKREKPAKYLDTYVHGHIKKIRAPGLIATESNIAVVDSERIAHALNKRGWNFVYNTDEELANELCTETCKEFKESKLFAPESWERYLEHKIAHTPTTELLDAEVEIWKQTRFPTPWLYLHASGTLERFLVSEGEEFFRPHWISKSGRMTEKGIYVRAPFVSIAIGYPHYQTTTIESR